MWTTTVLAQGQGAARDLALMGNWLVWRRPITTQSDEAARAAEELCAIPKQGGKVLTLARADTGFASITPVTTGRTGVLYGLESEIVFTDLSGPEPKPRQQLVSLAPGRSAKALASGSTRFCWAESRDGSTLVVSSQLWQGGGMTENARMRLTADDRLYALTMGPQRYFQTSADRIFWLVERRGGAAGGGHVYAQWSQQSSDPERVFYQRGYLRKMEYLGGDDARLVFADERFENGRILIGAPIAFGSIPASPGGVPQPSEVEVVAEEPNCPCCVAGIGGPWPAVAWAASLGVRPIKRASRTPSGTWEVVEIARGERVSSIRGEPGVLWWIDADRIVTAHA